MQSQSPTDFSASGAGDTSSYFDVILQNAKVNAMLLLDRGGIMMQANQAFLQTFGYEAEDLIGKHFRLLFTEEERHTSMPEREVQHVMVNGTATDVNFMLRKDGQAVWVSGESIRLSENADGCCIVKIIQNIHAQKLLETFLTEANELLDVVLQSVKHAALVVLDSGLRIVRVNEVFYEWFDIPKTDLEGLRSSTLEHAVWTNPETQRALRNALVTGAALKDFRVSYTRADGTEHALCMHFRMVEISTGDRHMLLVITEDKK